MNRQLRSVGIAGISGRALAQSQVETALRSSYTSYQYCLVDFLAEHLADASRSFGGDMQKVVLMAIIGQVHLHVVMAAESSRQSTEDFPPERRGILTNRLADVTGISRETTRRKLLELEQKGWLRREHGFWMLALTDEVAVAQHDLSDLDSRGIRRTAAFFVSLTGIVAN